MSLDAFFLTEGFQQATHLISFSPADLSLSGVI
jgi:hypothetical protein